MFTANSYHPDSQPLGHYKGYPIYLATVLVALHILSMLIGVVSPQSYMQSLIFAPGWFGSWAEIWRWFTYVFVQQPSLLFVLEMFFLYRFGMEIEKVFGRRALARLYAGLVLLPPLLITLAYMVSGGPAYPLAGTGFSHFCLFLGICLLYPGALMFCSLPWLTLKVAGSVLLAIYILMDLAARQWTHLGLLLANVILTYFVLRHAGLTPRFEAVKDALRDALPARKPQVTSRRALESGGTTHREPGSTSRYYEPKIKPKPDLAPERKAVEEIDSLLDKIARHGLDSLTAEEKAALQRASSKLKDGAD
jgi:membrane associated rhomboid family serine protease